MEIKLTENQEYILITLAAGFVIIGILVFAFRIGGLIFLIVMFSTLIALGFSRFVRRSKEDIELFKEVER